MALIKKIPIGLWLFQLPFVYLGYQYFVRDSLQVYDASSHLAQVKFLKDYLWPEINGFNYLNLLGFDQGLLYPSLFHYLAATLAFFVDSVLATKFVLLIAILVLPVSLYSFISTIFISRNSRVFVTGFLLVTLVSVPGYFGANVKGLLQIGLLPSFVSLPIVFLYLWSLLKAKPNWIMSALLLACVFLTHLVAGVFCLVFYLSFVLSQISSKKFSTNLLKQILLAMGLAAFFLVPFVFNYSLISQSAHLTSLFWPNLFILVVLLVCAASLWLFKREKLYSLQLAAVILGVFVVLDAIILTNYNDGFLFTKIYNLHLYRYQIYLYLLTVILFLYWPVQFLFEIPRKPKIKPELISLLPLAVVIFAIFFHPAFLVTNLTIKTTENSLDGRFLEVFNRQDSYPFIYSSQNNLVAKGKPWAYGLLTDSTPNGPYLSSLIRSFDPFAKPTLKENLIEQKSLDRTKLYDALDLFAIQNLLFLEPEKAVTSQTLDTRLLKSGVGQNLIEIPRWELKPTNANWDREVEKWWLSKGKMDSLLVEGIRQRQTATSSAKITSLKHSRDWTKFSFTIDSQDEVPVLVKFTHLPFWQATVEGKKVEIHRTSPYLMLIYGKGQVNFEYKRLWYQNLGLFISGLSLFIVLALGLKGRNQKHGKK